MIKYAKVELNCCERPNKVNLNYCEGHYKVNLIIIKYKRTKKQKNVARYLMSSGMSENENW